MQKETITKSELAKRVGDMVLFNNHSNVDEDWYMGLIEQPLMRERLDEIDAENGIEPDDMDAERATVSDFEIYQSFAITESGARYLINHTAELVSYSEKLELWFWHIGHYGMSWDSIHVEVTTWDYTENVTTYDTHAEMTRLTIM
jgi:hypothetical protein